MTVMTTTTLQLQCLRLILYVDKGGHSWEILSGKEFSINSVLVFEFDKSIKIKTIRVYYDSKMIYKQLDIMRV